jgi:hypothetical protein
MFLHAVVLLLFLKDEALQSDLAAARAYGMNTVRLHQKVACISFVDASAVLFIGGGMAGVEKERSPLFVATFVLFDST